MTDDPRFKRREDYLEEKEILAKADLAELEHNSGGFLGLANFLPRKGAAIGALARFKVLNEADRPIEYGGLLSGRKGGAVMAIILLVVAGLLVVNMVVRHL
ncbi:hypothetical protein [Aestuariispira insulae]|uniref:Uncharacterized protein n=1 Tax=Aestuariispira insulae TaxID=1461337 RepID=A0A3D9HVB0_9PROT|nr:hypothetical protein [Aestuariispira insulae]RED53428.1 hypothetical protein DFP90_101217 [Aestuariispira insulae]